MPARAHSPPRRRLGPVVAVVALSAALAAAGGVALALDAGTDLAADPGPPFAAGEQLVFEVSWLGIVAGTLEMTVEPPRPSDAPPAYRITSTARSNPFFTRIFPVDDRIESVAAATPFRSLRFSKRLREGSKAIDEEILFDPARNVALFEGQEVATPERVQDSLSALYYLRTLPLEPGNSLQVPVHSGGRNYDLLVDVLARERIETPFGRRVAIKVEPHRGYEGVFDRRGRLWVWLADEPSRLPLLMRSELPIGAIVARLVEYQRTGPLPLAAATATPAAGPALP